MLNTSDNRHKKNRATSQVYTLVHSIECKDPCTLALHHRCLHRAAKVQRRERIYLICSCTALPLEGRHGAYV